MAMGMAKPRAWPTDPGQRQWLKKAKRKHLMKTCKKCNNKRLAVFALVAILNTILKRYKIEASDYYTAVSAIEKAEAVARE